MLVVTLSVAAGGYVLLCLAAFLGQRALIYPAPRAAVPLPVDDPGFRRVGDAVLLWRPGPEGAPVLVHFHGNGEQLLDQEPLADAVHAAGLGFLAVEYPGYGWAEGAPTEAGLYDAAERGLAWLRAAQGVGPERVVLMGRSLGTGVAVEMARRGRGVRLVLVSPYTSMGDMAQAVFAWLPGRLLVRDRFDSLEKAPALALPALVVHGERDEVVPFVQGRRLAEALPQARFVPVPHAGHNDVLERAEGVIERLLAFARGS